jgi:anthranilate phosphoribosyltransferase
MTYAELVQPLIERRDLSIEQAEAMMHFLIGGEATDSQIGGILLGLRIKGCTTKELAAFARVMRQRASTIGHSFSDLVDTCGTGGGRPTFNVSTAAAIIASAAGARIAKHGNRSMTGMGSADVLEQLGITPSGDPEALLHNLETMGIVFLFAPAHHPAMKHVAKARKELGVRTVFNQLGPLANPAGATRQLIGVYEPGLMRSMGEALKELGADRVLLVHSSDGLDEISPTVHTQAVMVWDGMVSNLTLTPADFGLEPIPARALDPGESLEDCANILREAVSNPHSLRAQAVLPSAAAAIWIAGLEQDLPQATERARAAVADGLARQKLEQLISMGASS